MLSILVQVRLGQGLDEEKKDDCTAYSYVKGHLIPPSLEAEALSQQSQPMMTENQGRVAVPGPPKT